jgi:hypothetical protein
MNVFALNLEIEFITASMVVVFKASGRLFISSIIRGYEVLSTKYVKHVCH